MAKWVEMSMLTLLADQVEVFYGTRMPQEPCQVRDSIFFRKDHHSNFFQEGWSFVVAMAIDKEPPLANATAYADVSYD